MFDVSLHLLPSFLSPPLYVHTYIHTYIYVSSGSNSHVRMQSDEAVEHRGSWRAMSLAIRHKTHRVRGVGNQFFLLPLFLESRSQRKYCSVSEGSGNISLETKKHRVFPSVEILSCESASALPELDSRRSIHVT